MILLLLLLALCLYRISFAPFHNDYLGMKQSNSIKGFFIILVLLSHANGYLQAGGKLDVIYLTFFRFIGQLIVAMFFFYSGYGILESIKHKKNYVDTFLQNRILKTWLHFTLALPAYIVLNLIMKIQYPLHNYVLCWIGWESIGNSNWFIFVILVLYLSAYFAMRVAEKKNKENANRSVAINSRMIVGLIALCSVLMGIMLYVTKTDGRWWYDTMFCFCFGAFYSEAKAKFEALLQKNNRNYYASFFLLLLGMPIGFIGNAVAYNIAACDFCLLVIMITMKVKVCNPILEWFGCNLFPVYIFQRIPMIILSHYGLYQPLLFICISLSSIFCITLIYNSVISHLDRRVFRATKRAVH